MAAGERALSACPDLLNPGTGTRFAVLDNGANPTLSAATLAKFLWSEPTFSRNISGNFSVSGAAYITGDVTGRGNTTFGSTRTNNHTMFGNTLISGDVSVSGGIILTGNLVTSGNASLGTRGIGNNRLAGLNNSIEGSTTFTDPFVFNSYGVVSGDLSINGFINPDGLGIWSNITRLQVKDLNITGDLGLTIQSGLFEISSSSFILGSQTYLASKTVIIPKNLEVANVKLVGGSNGITGEVMVFSSDNNWVGGLNIAHNLFVSGNTILGDSSSDFIRINGNLFVNNSAQVNGRLVSSGDLTTSGQLFVSGAANFLKTGFFNSDLKVTGDTQLGANTATNTVVGGTLEVRGNQRLSGTLDVAARANFATDVAVTGHFYNPYNKWIKFDGVTKSAINPWIKDMGAGVTRINLNPDHNIVAGNIILLRTITDNTTKNLTASSLSGLFPVVTSNVGFLEIATPTIPSTFTGDAKGDIKAVIKGSWGISGVTRPNGTSTEYTIHFQSPFFTTADNYIVNSMCQQYSNVVNTFASVHSNDVSSNKSKKIFTSDYAGTPRENSGIYLNFIGI